MIDQPKLLAALSIAALLSGCAGTATSFAPPIVLTDNKVLETSTCKNMQQNGEIGANTTAGAANLVNNYVYAYRCYAEKLADGRQYFQVPGFLALAGTTTAVALGAGGAAAIAGGAFASTANAGNSYYAPAQKAAVVNKALSALLCIQAESVGVASYDPTIKNDAGKDSSKTLTNGASVEISWATQYYILVKSALLNVETVVRERLGSAGTYNPSGTIAEINAIQAKVTEQEDKKKADAKAKADAAAAAAKPKTQQVAEETKSSGDTAKPGAKPLSANQVAAAANGKSTGTNQIASVTDLPPTGGSSRIDLDIMQPKLQLCVERAKL